LAVRSAAEPRRVWLAALVVTVVCGGILAAELLRPRDFYTGTNTAGSAGPVHHVDAGHTFCVGGLVIPKGTHRLQLRVASVSRTDVRFAVDGRSGTVQIPPTGGPAGLTPALLDVPTARTGPSRLCLVPSAPIDISGRPERFAGQTAPTLDGQPVKGVAAVWYLPADGLKRSVFSQLSDIARRAALFRPGLVGPWTYWLLLLVVPVLVAGAAIALVARAATLGRVPRGAAASVAAIGVVAAASWSLLTPLLSAPDELEHIAYAQAVAEQGRAPSAGPSPRRPYSTEAQAAYEGARMPGQYRQFTGRPPWTASAERDWVARERAMHARGDDGAGWTTVADYTPTYYAALAPAYLAAKPWSFWSRVSAMRLLTALMGGMTAAFAVLLVRELLPRPGWPAVVAGLLVALQPMVSFVSGMVNNDGPVIMLGAAALWLTVRGLRRGLTPHVAVALGAVAVAAPMTKGNGLFLLPAMALGLLGMAFRGRLTRSSVMHGAAGVVGTLLVLVALAAGFHHSANPTAPGWYASSGNVYPTTPGIAVAPSRALHEPLRFAEYLWQMALPPLPGMEDVRPGGVRVPAYTAYVQRAWGAFVFAVAFFPRWLYALIMLVLAGIAALGVRLVFANRTAVRQRGWEIAVLVTAIVCVILGTELAYYAPKDTTVPEFGRYLFPAAAAFAALAVGALFGAGRRAAPALGGGLTAAMAVLWWAGLWLTAAQLYT
jgi:4-amino-4-deoxy-L-arabinose transferase-like glycosyltransferase